MKTPVKLDAVNLIPVEPSAILQRVSQAEIFTHYLRIPVVMGRKFRSPLRVDRKPSCNFLWSGTKLRFYDWSTGEHLDCFDVVQKVKQCGFRQALEHIMHDLNLAEKEPTLSAPTATYKGKSIIRVKIQPHTETDLMYLDQFGITEEIAKRFKCFSIATAWINGRHVYSYSSKNPVLGYYLGDDQEGQQKWKLYFYRRIQNRFLSNTQRINGWSQLPAKGPLLVLTKSMKDVMVLSRFGVPAIAMQSEKVLPYDYIIGQLEERFSRLVIFYDFDYAGVTAAAEIRRQHGLPAVFLTNGRYQTPDYGSKDISDYLRDHGLDKTKALLRRAAEHLSIAISKPTDESTTTGGDRDSSVYHPRTGLEEETGEMVPPWDEDPQEVSAPPF